MTESEITPLVVSSLHTGRQADEQNIKENRAVAHKTAIRGVRCAHSKRLKRAAHSIVSTDLPLKLLVCERKFERAEFCHDDRRIAAAPPPVIVDRVAQRK